MRKLLKKHLQNEKGLTLIELLVVVVILGIIAAIAIVAIGNILDNSKKDAHIANAKTMVDAARMFVAQNGTDGVNELTMQKLVDDGFLEGVPKSPGKAGDYDTAKSKVSITVDQNTNTKVTYTVTLVSKDTGKAYIKPIEPNDLDRSKVFLKGDQ
ncbi:prepilin-type N-terminal cleavage/methylation domain-containing protein [Fictibacillus gelatini]|uniref:prepilin-type N-terminal cleavage/methylation domain-containing protein n=1 Tax=Fictibacillus gelatini TaxID=225985 RepID=UPI00041FB146|nr:prepilin-type N-terminal cleavage/methylation domain-containing protein [Fictibacillus gelatini]